MTDRDLTRALFRHGMWVTCDGGDRMSDRELSRLRLIINLLDSGPGLQRPALENRHSEAAVLHDAEPQQGGTLRRAAKQARISTQISSR